MSELPGLETRSSSRWMTDVREQLDPLMEVVKAVDPKFQPALFERLLEIVLHDARKDATSPISPSAAVLANSAPTIPMPASSAVGEPGNARFDQFVKDYNLSVSTLANIVDFETGHILTRNLGSGKADKQRRIAALLAIINAKRSGAFYVAKDDLVRVCDEHGALDTSNFQATMRRTVYKSTAVFASDENGYRVSRPGEEFLAEVVRLVQPQPSSSASQQTLTG